MYWSQPNQQVVRRRPGRDHLRRPGPAGRRRRVRPGRHTVAEVNEYLAANPDDADRVLAAERTARPGCRSWETMTDIARRRPPSGTTPPRRRRTCWPYCASKTATSTRPASKHSSRRPPHLIDAYLDAVDPVTGPPAPAGVQVALEGEVVARYRTGSADPYTAFGGLPPARGSLYGGEPVTTLLRPSRARRGVA